MRHIERVMRRRLVRQFIAEDPVDVRFVRTTRVRTPAGGWVTGSPQTLDPQRGRINVAKRRFSSVLVNTEAGNIIEYPFILEGYHDMDIQVDDFFTWDGNVYQVKSIDPDREERTVAAIDFYGPPKA